MMAEVGARTEEAGRPDRSVGHDRQAVPRTLG